LRGTVQSKPKGFTDPIFDVSKALIGLKLPLALPKDTINKDSIKTSEEDLKEWKEFLTQVNKK
jgi:hypothetical protein